MCRWLSLAVLCGCISESASFGVIAGGHSAALHARHAAVEMKGRGTRGMPGKGVKPPPGSGFNGQSKKRMSQRDFQKSEWTLVAEKNELGEEIGSTMAVEAGQSPQGGNYIWTLIRGPQGAGAVDSDDDSSNVWATDGSCRACSFPMIKSVVEKEASGEYSMLCPTCGSKWNLADGEVIDWLPAANPAQWALKKINEKKEPMAAGILRTRVAQSGRVYVRLPDGTLSITESAADRAAQLAETTPLSQLQKVRAAQEKAKGN